VKKFVNTLFANVIMKHQVSWF